MGCPMPAHEQGHSSTGCCIQLEVLPMNASSATWEERRESRLVVLGGHPGPPWATMALSSVRARENSLYTKTKDPPPPQTPSTSETAFFHSQSFPPSPLPSSCLLLVIHSPFVPQRRPFDFDLDLDTVNSGGQTKNLLFDGVSEHYRQPGSIDCGRSVAQVTDPNARCLSTKSIKDIKTVSLPPTAIPSLDIISGHPLACNIRSSLNSRAV